MSRIKYEFFTVAVKYWRFSVLYYGGGVKRKLNVSSPTLDNLEWVEFNPPEQKHLAKTLLWTTCNIYLRADENNRQPSVLIILCFSSLLTALI